MNTKHPHFRRCYDEGVAAQTTGEANPYVPGTDEHSFFDAGEQGRVFHETKEEIKADEATTLVASPAEANTDTSSPVTLAVNS